MSTSQRLENWKVSSIQSTKASIFSGDPSSLVFMKSLTNLLISELSASWSLVKTESFFLHPLTTSLFTTSTLLSFWRIASSKISEIGDSVLRLADWVLEVDSVWEFEVEAVGTETVLETTQSLSIGCVSGIDSMRPI